MGNDAILSLIHEARMQFLRSLDYTELDFAGASLIMADVAIEFKKELFYGEIVQASVTSGDFSRSSFDLYYKLEKEVDGIWQKVATAKTGMVCFNYQSKRVSPVPEEAQKRLLG